MSRTMHAAVVEKFREPLVLKELPIPTPAAGQILVKTEACGVCHTDLHAARGDWPVKPVPPFIPGHEAIGIVVALGAGVTAVKEGDRVGVPWLYSACGHCEHCLAAWATVCGVDIDDGKLAHATRLGADLVINAREGDPAATLKRETGGGAHGVLITAPSLPAFKQGVEMTRKRGTCVLVGLPPGEFPVPLFDVVANCVTIRGSFVGTRLDMAECLAFAADGKVKADIELSPLSAINDVFARLQRGDVPSRVVLDFSPA